MKRSLISQQPDLIINEHKTITRFPINRLRRQEGYHVDPAAGSAKFLEKTMKELEKLERQRRMLRKIGDGRAEAIEWMRKLLRLRHTIHRSPGTSLLAVVDFLYSPKTVEEVFSPIIADWRFEYFETLKQQRQWKARWIGARYRYRFLQAMGLSKVADLIKGVLGLAGRS